MLQDAAAMSPIERFKESPSSLTEKMAAGQIPIDWGFAEMMAYGSLLSEPAVAGCTP
jgi:2-oxoglutarate dehydrogenase complex dehydrogenase (E1) component-like enzyme